MWTKIRTKTAQVLIRILALCMVFILPAGCVRAKIPTSVPSETSVTAPEPTNTPQQEDEKVVYVSQYEVYPPAQDPSIAFPVERVDGLWFFRQVEFEGEWCYCLMHRDADATDEITIVTFDKETVPEWMCFLDESCVWVKMLDFQTWESTLLEVSLETGESLQRITFPAENGVPISIFDLPDRSLGISAEDEGEQRIYKLEEDGTFTLLTVLQSTEDRGYLTILGTMSSGLQPNECMAYDGKGLIAVNSLTGEWRELLHWADWGIGNTIVPLGLRTGVVRLLDYGYNEAITITPTPRNQVPVRQELTMSCLTVEADVAKAIQDFNRRSGEWYITIQDYSGGETFTRDVRDRAITAMNLDIVNGNMPDLLSIRDGVPFKSWAGKGYLKDLGPWLESEGIELLPQLRRAGTVDGKLLMVCGSFTILTAAGNRDVLGDMQSWTAAEAAELAASHPDCAGVFTSGMTRDRYLDLLDSYLEGYLDWDAGTASFDSPGFRDVLTIAASLPVEGKAENTADAEIMHGWALVNAATVESVRDWQLWDVTYMGNLACPGIPASDRVGSLIQMRSPMAVSAVSTHAEGAYIFLRSLLAEETQVANTAFFPSVNAAFKKHMAEAMREPKLENGYSVTYIMANGFRMEESLVHLWDGKEDERIPRGIVRWYDENYTQIREEKLFAMSELQRDSLQRLLDRAVRSTSYDQVIAGIVREEVGAYFAGQRSAEEVSKRIQSRVELYMAEYS